MLQARRMNSEQILERLISFPTVSRDSNLALIEYVRDFLASCGVRAKLYWSATVARPTCMPS